MKSVAGFKDLCVIKLYTMPHTDHKYIEALIKNDSLLIEAIYKQHAHSITRMVLQNNGNKMDAADLFQDVLLELHRKAMDGFQLTCPLGGFLHLMCRSRWINEIQKRSRTRQKLRAYTATIATEADCNLEEVEQHKKMQQRELLKLELDNMGEKRKHLLVQATSGKPLKEVAGQLNVSYAYLRKRKTELIGTLASRMRACAEFAMLANIA